MPLTSYNVPSATKQVCLTETELLALQFPAPKKVTSTKWQPIPGEVIEPCPKLGDGYFITNSGRVMHRKTKANGRVNESEIKGTIKRNHKTILVTNGTNGKVAIRVSRVLLETFKPHKKSAYLQAVALDGNTLNLHIDNWSWMSVYDATRYRKDTGEAKPKLHTREIEGRRGIYTKRVIYSDAEVKEIERLLVAGIAMGKIAEIFECSLNFVTQTRKQLEKKLKNDG